MCVPSDVQCLFLHIPVEMDVLQTVRKSVILFFLGFPLIMISLVGFLAVSLGNMGMLFLFIGQAFVVPIATTILHMLTYFAPDAWSKVTPSDIAQLVPSDPVSASQMVNVAPSYWVAQVVFFCAYVLSNAIQIYKLEVADDSPDQQWRVENRKARAKMILGGVSVLVVALLFMRWRMTGAETPFGILVGLLTAGPLGYAWYQLATQIGIRHGDIFGIVQQMIPIDSAAATVCTKSA